jgi:hypothetical protein
MLDKRFRTTVVQKFEEKNKVTFYVLHNFSVIVSVSEIIKQNETKATELSRSALAAFPNLFRLKIKQRGNISNGVTGTSFETRRDEFTATRWAARPRNRLLITKS